MGKGGFPRSPANGSYLGLGTVAVVLGGQPDSARVAHQGSQAGCYQKRGERDVEQGEGEQRIRDSKGTGQGMPETGKSQPDWQSSRIQGESGHLCREIRKEPGVAGNERQACCPARQAVKPANSQGCQQVGTNRKQSPNLESRRCCQVC